MKPDSSPSKVRSEQENADIADFIHLMHEASAGSKKAAAAGLDALPRLAKACHGETGSQAQIIMSWLASRYNGGDALPVRLDAINGLDWTLAKDLVAVILGCGRTGFPDTKIREALHAVGGAAAVEELHWHTTGGPHRAALIRLIEFIRENPSSSSARRLKKLLTSIVSSDSETVPLSVLGYIDDEHTKDFCLILDGLYGRSQGQMTVEEIQQAIELIPTR